MPTRPITKKAIGALRLLRGTNRLNTLSAKALAYSLWPERLADCGNSPRRGGYYRAAGAYFSSLERMGLCGHWMDDFNSGYYITAAGLVAIDAS